MNRPIGPASNRAYSELLFSLRRIAVMATSSESNRSVGLSMVGHSACIDKWLIISRGLGSKMFTYLHTVKCTHNNWELRVELIVVDLSVNVVRDCSDQEGRVHSRETEFENLGFGKTDVSLSKVKLAIEVGLFNKIKVDDCNVFESAPTKILENFTANTACPYH